MKAIFSILIGLSILTAPSARAQGKTLESRNSPDPYFRAGYYMNHHLYDSAIACYQELWKSDPEHRRPYTYTLNCAAICYLKKEDTASAIGLLLQCLASDPKKDYPGARQTASLELADVYYRQYKYRLALEYINASQTRYAPLMRQCLGGFGYWHDLSLAYKRALCYYGLKESDSVIHLLSPLAFATAQVCPDSVLLSSVNSFYVKVLNEVYGKEAVKTELARAMAATWYKHIETPHVDTGLTKPSGIDKDIFITCGTTFFDIPLFFCDMHYLHINGSCCTVYEYGSLAYFAAEAKKTPAYRMIMGE